MPFISLNINLNESRNAKFSRNLINYLNRNCKAFSSFGFRNGDAIGGRSGICIQIHHNLPRLICYGTLMHLDPGVLRLELAHLGRRSRHRLEGMHFSSRPNSFGEFLGVIAHIGADIEHTHAGFKAGHHRRIKARLVTLGDVSIQRVGLDQPQYAYSAQSTAKTNESGIRVHNNQVNRVRIRSANRSVSCMSVSVGLELPPVGNTEQLATNRLSRPCTRSWASTTPWPGLAAMRVPPMR